MDWKAALKTINENPQKYLQRDGSGKGYICPICGSGSGKKGTGITTRDGGKHFTCWTGCFTNRSLVDIFAIKAGIKPTENNFRACLEAACKACGIALDNSTAKGSSLQVREQGYLARCVAAVGKTDYFGRRGITGRTINLFPIGYDEHYDAGGGQYWQAIVFFTSPTTWEARNTAQDASDGNRYRKHGAGHLFNVAALEVGAPVFVVEGIMDALSIIEAGGAAVGLGSVAQAGLFVDAVRERGGKCPPLLLALDNDDAGKKAAQELAEKLKDLGAAVEIVDICGEHKDPNDALMADRKKFAEIVKEKVEAAKKKQEADINAQRTAYHAKSAINHLMGYLGKWETARPFISTGFSSLDSLLGGGLYAGLHIIGAISSLGKTSLCLQMADQIAMQGRDVIFFSLEMAEDELIAKSISRITLQESRAKHQSSEYAMSTRDIMTAARGRGEKAKDVLLSAINVYGEYGEHIFIQEGVGNIGVADVRKSTEEHIRQTGITPVVFVDYLQILAPENDRGSDKQNTDKAVLELKRLSRDMAIPVIAISSFNRGNYTESVGMTAFKESGAIEYSADVLLGAQYCGMDYEEGEDVKDRAKRIRGLLADVDARGRRGEPVEVEVKVLKQRNGIRGSACFRFHARRNFFEEITGRGTGLEEMFHTQAMDDRDIPL